MRTASRLLAITAASLVLTAIGWAFVAQAAGPSPLPRRAFVPLAASDAATPTPVPTRVPPPPGPGYCVPSDLNIPSPPNVIAGHFTIAGQPAPAGTLVTMTFDGGIGVSAYTTAEGGYRVDYAAGGAGHDPPCINQVGAEMGLLVNGVLVDTGVRVGDLQAYLFFLFDLNIP